MPRGSAQELLFELSLKKTFFGGNVAKANFSVPLFAKISFKFSQSLFDYSTGTTDNTSN